MPITTIGTSLTKSTLDLKVDQFTSILPPDDPVRFFAGAITLWDATTYPAWPDLSALGGGVWYPLVDALRWAFTRFP